MKNITYNDENISKLALGTVQFGLSYGVANKDGQPTQDNVNEILDYVFSKGINCLDTAQGYGNSEEVIGEYLNGLDVNSMHIVSKIDSKELILRDLDFINSIQTSVTKLKIDCLFGLLMHNSDLMNKWNNVFSKKIEILKEKKIIKYFGVSIYTNDEFDLALTNKDIDIIQIPFNMFDQRALKNKWFEKAKKKNKLIFIRSIYLQGLLLMEIGDIPEKLIIAKKYIEKLDDIAGQLKITKNELCLSFVNTIAQDSSLLFGCETLSQARENLNIFNNMKDLNKSKIEIIVDSFKGISENIYNPTKW